MFSLFPGRTKHAWGQDRKTSSESWGLRLFGVDSVPGSRRALQCMHVCAHTHTHKHTQPKMLGRQEAQSSRAADYSFPYPLSPRDPREYLFAENKVNTFSNPVVIHPQTGQGLVPEALLISAEMVCEVDILRFAHSAGQSGFQRRIRSRSA